MVVSLYCDRFLGPTSSFYHSVRRSRNAEMNIFIILTIYLSFIFHPSHGYEVFQPHNRTVNPDGSVFISCEHTANDSSVKDVRLNAISPTDKPRVLCQMGMKSCKDIIMQKMSPNKWLFIKLSVDSEAMGLTYQCKITVTEDDLDYDWTGTPTKLLPGQKEVVCVTPPPPPPPPRHELRWILIGLLALMFLYSCVITSFYVRLRCSDSNAENSTYVEMRKVPLPRNRPVDNYCI